MWATIITAALESLISVTKPPNLALQGDFQAMSHFCGLQGSGVPPSQGSKAD